MVKRGSPKKRKAASNNNNTTTTSTTTSAPPSSSNSNKKSKGTMFGKSKKKGGNRVNSVQEMFLSIAEDPADPDSVVNMEGTDRGAQVSFVSMLYYCCLIPVSQQYLCLCRP